VKAISTLIRVVTKKVIAVAARNLMVKRGVTTQSPPTIIEAPTGRVVILWWIINTRFKTRCIVRIATA
jgi:hypothetical protein